MLTNKPPSICIAAAAAPNCAAGVLAVSRPVYMEVRWLALLLQDSNACGARFDSCTASTAAVLVEPQAS